MKGNTLYSKVGVVVLTLLRKVMSEGPQRRASMKGERYTNMVPK